MASRFPAQSVDLEAMTKKFGVKEEDWISVVC